MGFTKSRPMTMNGEVIQRNRRLSHGSYPSVFFFQCDCSQAKRVPTDETPTTPRRFLVDVEETMRLVLAQEDTDNK